MVVLDYVLSIILILVYIFAGCSLMYGWWKTPFFIPKPISQLEKLTLRVSVLIAARNEEDTIAFLVKDLLSQDYPENLLEIIVVDDHSTDKTAQKVLDFQNPRIRLIKLNESEALNSYKKKAIATAIDSSMGEFILTTDADCRLGPSWVSTMAQFFSQKKVKMVSASVAFLDEGSIFQKFQSMEFAVLIGLGAAAIQNGYPFTCNGANLGYSKKTFYELGGFKGIDDLASGDDELLLHKVASHYPGEIGFVKSPGALILTHAKKNLREFIGQRRRWASKSIKYKNRGMISFAVMAFFFNIFLMLNGFLCFFFPVFRILWVIQISVKIIMELGLMIPVLKFMGQIKYIFQILIFLPIYFIGNSLYMGYIGLAGNSGKYEWKGRMVN